MLLAAGVLAGGAVLVEKVSLPLWAAAVAAGAAMVANTALAKPIERAQEFFDLGRRAAAHRRHLVHGAPVRVRDADPVGDGGLGVTASRSRDGGEGGGTDRLPDYVPRERLENEVRDRLRGSGIVLLTGPSASGKSRLAYEVVRGMYPKRRLFRPRRPGGDGSAGVRGLVAEDAVPRKAVVWLDGLEDYIAQGLEGDDVYALAPEGSGNVIVATMRDRHGRPGEEGPAGRPFFDKSPDIVVRVPVERADSEGFAAPDTDDRRVLDAFAQDRYGVTEYLSRGPVAYQFWEGLTGSADSHRAGAVVTAAVEARRAGRHAPLPAGLLRELHEPFVDGAEGRGAGRQTFEEALEEATTRIGGAEGCLRSSDTEPGAFYAFDYLVDRWEREADRPIPEEALEALVEHTRGGELDNLAETAADQELWPLVERAARKHLAELPEDDPAGAGALRLLGWALLYSRDRLERAEEPLRRSAGFGDLRAAILLGSELNLVERYEEAAEVLAPAAEAGRVRGLFEHARACRELGRFAEARGELDLLYRAARDGEWDDPEWISLRAVADNERAAGEWEAAKGAYRELAERTRDDPEARGAFRAALEGLARTSAGEGDTGAALEWAEAGVREDMPWSYRFLVEHFARTGETLMRRAWEQRAADAGLLWALLRTGALQEDEVAEEADSWEARVAEQGDEYSELVLRNIRTERLLKEMEQHLKELERLAGPGAEQVKRILENADRRQAGLPPLEEDGEPQEHGAPDPAEAVEQRCEELQSEKRYGEAADLLRAAVEAGDRGHLAELGRCLLLADRPEEAVEPLRCAVEETGEDTRLLASALEESGTEGELERLLRTESEREKQWAVVRLADLLERQGRHEELIDHCELHICLGSHAAALKLAEYFMSSREHGTAWRLLDFAGQGGNFMASSLTGLFLSIRGEWERAVELHRLGGEIGVPFSLRKLPEALARTGRCSEAEEAFADAERKLEELGSAMSPWARLDYAEALLDQGWYESARARAAEMARGGLDAEDRKRLAELERRCAEEPARAPVARARRRRRGLR